MKVLVTGGRDYADWGTLCNALNMIHHKHGPITHVIHGGARGADSLAGQWARIAAVQEVRCDANWEQLGKSAGHVRNQRMAELDPDLVLHFPGGRGTAGMVEIARRFGLHVENALELPT